MIRKEMQNSLELINREIFHPVEVMYFVQALNKISSAIDNLLESEFGSKASFSNIIDVKL
jgi:hypothetical protein